MKGGSTVIAFVQDPDGYKIELIEHLPATRPFTGPCRIGPAPGQGAGVRVLQQRLEVPGEARGVQQRQRGTPSVQVLAQPRALPDRRPAPAASRGTHRASRRRAPASRRVTRLEPDTAGEGRPRGRSAPEPRPTVRRFRSCASRRQRVEREIGAAYPREVFRPAQRASEHQALATRRRASGLRAKILPRSRIDGKSARARASPASTQRVSHCEDRPRQLVALVEHASTSASSGIPSAAARRAAGSARRHRSPDSSAAAATPARESGTRVRRHDLASAITPSIAS